MQEHNRKRKSGKRRFKNQNRRLTDDCRSTIKSLIEGFRSSSPALDYLRSEYLSKFTGEGYSTPEQRRSAAILKWKTQERTNAETNLRIRGRDRGYNLLPRITWYRFLAVAQRIIADILGPLHDEVVLGNFSGGASTSRRRTEGHAPRKFCGMADVTKDAVQYVDVIHRQSGLYRQYGTFYSLREVDGAVLFTVPKKSDIDRCACKEPEINMFLQKGVGLHIRRRLRKVGINLNDQSINRRYARLGSIDESLATIDLSSASDSVTISCVLSLLPHDWFLYLNDIRSRHVVIDGEITETEMFSSMGNGFTFELESLIFYALMKTTAYLRGHPGVISVYGDDLIIPSGMFDDAVWVLQEFGFSCNTDKSFSSGPFRESCGGHYHHGDDFTPFYLRREPIHLTDLIRVANQLRRWALSDPSRQYVHPECYQLWSRLRDYVPEDLWGGVDYALDTQLVSPHGFRKRLVRLQEDVSLPPVGQYMHWHTLNRSRSWDPEDGNPPVSTNSVCRKRAAKLGAVAFSEWFREELL